MKIEPGSGQPIALINVGHIQHVLAGRVPSSSRERWIDVSDAAYGFMAGSPKGLASMGELVIWDGMAYVKATDESGIASGTRIVSTSCVMLDKGAQPQWRIPDSRVDLSWEEVLALISERTRQPFLVAGSVTFSSLHGKAIVQAPIYGKSAYDIESPPKHLRAATTRVVGCAADATAPLAQTGVDVVLYRHPKDPSRLITHTHVLVLKESQMVSPESVEDVLHLFSDSRVERVALEIFPISGVIER